MNKMNPLHTPEAVMQQMQATGEYFDPKRRSGRSTALALNYISRAINTPHLAISIKDHNPHDGQVATKLMNERLMQTIQHMLRVLGLKHMLLDFNKQTITFTTTTVAGIAPKSLWDVIDKIETYKSMYNRPRSWPTQQPSL